MFEWAHVCRACSAAFFAMCNLFKTDFDQSHFERFVGTASLLTTAQSCICSICCVNAQLLQRIRWNMNFFFHLMSRARDYNRIDRIKNKAWKDDHPKDMKESCSYICVVVESLLFRISNRFILLCTVQQNKLHNTGWWPNVHIPFATSFVLNLLGIISR